jgi:hypothetical protein
MKFKTRILFTLAACIPFLLQAQITLTTQVSNTGVMLKDQLWNVIITNNTNDIANVKIELDVTDLLIGQSVLNASSGKLSLGKGMKIITIRDMQPVVYNFAATEFTGNYIPCGSYRVHHRLIQETTKGDIPVADEVTSVNVTPMSPPLLIYPEDKSGTDNVYPQFTWMPPAPAEMFSPLVYDLNVVMIEDGQSPKEAIEFNRPVYSNTNIQSPPEKMPTSFEQLQQGKSYAWQVTARSGMACASPTDVWVFSIGKDSVSKIIESAPYTRLSTAGTEITTAQEGIVKMEYLNNINDKEVKCTVYKANEKEKKGRKEIHFTLKVSNGQNYLSYNVGKKLKGEKNMVYELSLKNGRGEEWLMQFVPVYKDK